MALRCRIPLDGSWQFWPDPETSLTPTTLSDPSAPQPTQIVVPAPWQSQSEDLRFYSGAAWYQREIELPEDWFPGWWLALGINAADYFTEVWFNGRPLGRHEGGYLPFEFDVTHAARPGLNLITLRVEDPPGLFSEIPHGKQDWYGPISGIWQSIWLERRAPLHVRRLGLESERESGRLEVEIDLSQPAIDGSSAAARVYDPEGERVVEQALAIPPEESRLRFTLTVPNAQDWSPSRPRLYRLEVELQGEAGRADGVEKRFGFRTIEARQGRFYLNGEPLYLRGALDQDYYPETIYTAPDERFLEDQLLKARSLGLNCLRVHIKVADPRYLELADRLGVLIWAELPNWSVFTRNAACRGRETLQGILERDGHHPSIIAWTIVNESWGMDLTGDARQRAWLKETYRWLKELDPTRLVVDNSPCKPNFHLQTDIEDYHVYRAIPDHRREWDRFVQEFASRAAWTFSPAGDALPGGEEPLVVSEFGNWGLPHLDRLLEGGAGEPWWFETGREWGDGAVYPHGAEARFRALGLERIFGSWQGLAEATQWQQYASLKYEIEAIRRRPEISGYVITELTDVHWECNGLLDMRRNPKVFCQALAEINADTVILPEWQRLAFWEGEPVCFDLAVAHGAGPELDGAMLRWRLEGEPISGQIALPKVKPGEVKPIGTVEFRTPAASRPAVRRLSFELHIPERGRISSNHLDLALFPRRAGAPSFDRGARLYTPGAQLAARLEALGYPLASRLQEASLVLADRLDENGLEYLQAGGRVVLLADRAPLEEWLLPGIRAAKRAGSPWSGDWATSFSWLDRRGVFNRFPGGPLVDFTFDRIIPERILLGYRDWEFPALVPSGLFVGWVHKPVALIGLRHFGEGKAVLSTFRLEERLLGEDPAATNLLDALVELASC